MKLRFDFCARVVRFFLFAFCLVAGVRSASAFALLGPFAPWMTQQLSYQDGVSIGGPMNIGEGYRWNVPVITYGYDQSFLDFFGTNGVSAVESAIQVLNNLPPASQIDPATFPLDSKQVNYSAQAQSLTDLKSFTLALLLEHMGLAQPSEFVFSLDDFSIVNGKPVYTVLNRNYDPITWEPSTNVNGVGYASQILFNDVYEVIGSNVIEIQSNPADIPMSPLIWAAAIPNPVDPLKAYYFAVADYVPRGNGLYHGLVGSVFSGLTRDDAGGLGYLLNSNTLALESLIPGVQGAGTNASNFVNTALRPGVEKITFQRVDYLSPTNRVFPLITNTYVDSYISNGLVQQQTLQRVITQPDILFTAHYIGTQPSSLPLMSLGSRTGTTNWVNNGAPGRDGPGVIQPPVQINFNRLGPSLQGSGVYPSTNNAAWLPFWASFDETTNAAVLYPASTVTNGTTFFFLLQTSTHSSYSIVPPSITQSVWTLSGQPKALYMLQTSTNLQKWVTITTITNVGGTYTYYDMVYTNTPQRYFRTVPQ